jgi:hypothetical protein
MPPQLTHFAILVRVSREADKPGQDLIFLRHDEDERAACAAVIEMADGRTFNIFAVKPLTDEDFAERWDRGENPIVCGGESSTAIDARFFEITNYQMDRRRTYTYQFRRSERCPIDRAPLSVSAYEPEMAWQVAKQIARNSPDLLHVDYERGSGEFTDGSGEGVHLATPLFFTTWMENATYIVACLLCDKALLLRPDFLEFIKDQQFDPNHHRMADAWKLLCLEEPMKHDALADSIRGVVTQVFADVIDWYDPPNAAAFANRAKEILVSRIWKAVTDDQQFAQVFERHAVPKHAGLRRLLRTAALEMETAIFDPDYVVGLLMVDRIDSEDIQPWLKGTTLLSGGGCVLTKRGINLFADICAAASPKEV